VQSRERLFTGRNQILVCFRGIVLRDFVEFFVELRELCGFRHVLAVEEVGRLVWRIAWNTLARIEASWRADRTFVEEEFCSVVDQRHIPVARQL